MKTNRLKRTAALALCAALAVSLFSGCASTAAEPVEPTGPIPTIPAETMEEAYVDPVDLELVELEDEVVALSAAPAAVGSLLLPVASGTKTEKNAKAVIDYSNTGDGYVMVQFTAASTVKLKVIVKGPTTDYQYNLTVGQWATFPLADGNGTYKVSVYEQASGNKYATVLSKEFSVTLKDEFAPFVRPNQYVDYANATNTVAQAQKLVTNAGVTEPLDKVSVIYNYVVNNLTYDTAKAQSVQSGYLPVLDDVLSAKKGICFDYAALMTGMLRSQNVPCKLVVGYAGTAYHAWVSVWTKETGWVDGAIYFDGTTWHRMDPTFASSGKSSSSIMQYIGDGSNYSTKYVY